jgi:hypothetical protein
MVRSRAIPHCSEVCVLVARSQAFHRARACVSRRWHAPARGRSAPRHTTTGRVAASRCLRPPLDIRRVRLALILGIDQLAGATLSLSSIFSYSPLIGFRFFGIGNEGAAILFGGALVGLSLELDAAKSSARVRRISIAGVGAAAVIVCAAPFFGANVIVAVWGTATFAAFWLAAERRRIRTADMLFALALVGAAFAAMVALDRYTGGTHIGRAVGEVAGGGLGALLAERFATSLRIFMDSPLPAIVLIIATILAYMRLRPRGRMAVVLGRYPVFAAAMTAGLLGGFIGALTEDSGVVVLALVITYLVGGLVALMLEPDGSVVA